MTDSLVGMNLLGADELAEMFQGVTNSMRTRVLKAAVQAAGDIIKMPLYYATPVAMQTGPSAKFPAGQTRSATAIRVKAYQKGSVVMAVIGHRHPQGSPAGWLERGTKPRFTKSGHRTGFVQAKPFFRPVWDRLKGTAMRAMRDQIAAGLKAFNKRADKKFSKTLDIS